MFLTAAMFEWLGLRATALWCIRWHRPGVCAISTSTPVLNWIDSSAPCNAGFQPAALLPSVAATGAL
jgi:hypothetical protein